MAKSIFFAHSGGAQSNPGEGSYDLVEWLRQNLPDYQVSFPLIADPEAPSWEMWQKMFQQELEPLAAKTLLIGHSLGGSMLLKYLSEQPDALKNTPIKAFILISTPVWGTTDWKVAEFGLKPDYVDALPDLPEIHIFHSEADSIVPYKHAEIYQQQLPDAVLHLQPGDNHVFSEGLPELIALIRELEQSDRP